MTSILRALLLTLLLTALSLASMPGQARSTDSPREFPAAIQTVRLTDLPQEARETYALILRGGPFPFRRDGIEFQNRERRLPARSRGYYHEYTVPTPGAADRGARRIITGGSFFYYTADHYRSFQQITP